MHIHRRRFLTTASIGAILSAGPQVRGQSPRERMINERATRSTVAGLSFLQSRQNDDGAFGANDRSRDIGVCSLGGMAFLANGSLPGRGTYGKQLTKCVDFLLNNADKNGFIVVPEHQSSRPMYGHGFATMFLAEAFGSTQRADHREKLSKAIQIIIGSQNSDGGWRYQPRQADADLSVTVCQIMALRAAKDAGFFVPKQTIASSLHYVRKCQNDDGGFSYQVKQGSSEFARSAAAITAFFSAGIYDSREVRRGIEYLRQFQAAPSDRDGQPYFFYGHYYAALALWQSKAPWWPNWYAAIRDELIRRQSDDGSWKTPAWTTEYATAMATIILQIPKGAVPLFQR